MSKIESLIQFLTVDIWRMSHDKRTEKHGMWIAVFKKLYLAVQFFIDKGVMAAASALSIFVNVPRHRPANVSNS